MLLGVLCAMPTLADKPNAYITVPRTAVTDQNKYFLDLLALALEKTARVDGAMDIRFYDYSFTGSRLMADLEHGKSIDIAWNGTNPEREERLLPIKISLLERLNGYRVLLIRAEDQAAFSAVKKLEDLRQFRAGSGVDWPSTDLLRHNHLPLTTAARKDLLFTMLKAHRFDYMTRNLCEVWNEIEQLQSQGIVVEKDLMLHSGIPFYFFVNRDNPRLAERIERGLKMAIKDGSFNKLFHETTCFQQGMREINAKKRRVLHLE